LLGYGSLLLIAGLFDTYETRVVIKLYLAGAQLFQVEWWKDELAGLHGLSPMGAKALASPRSSAHLSPSGGEGSGTAPSSGPGGAQPQGPSFSGSSAGRSSGSSALASSAHRLSPSVASPGGLLPRTVRFEDHPTDTYFSGRPATRAAARAAAAAARVLSPAERSALGGALEQWHGNAQLH
jgi:hypothetical protein